MACWGFHALESDEGLLLLDCIGEKLAAGKKSLKLADIVALLRSEKLLESEAATNTEDYDLAVLALSEFYNRMQGEKNPLALKNSRHALRGLEELEEIKGDPESLGYLTDACRKFRMTSTAASAVMRHFGLRPQTTTTGSAMWIARSKPSQKRRLPVPRQRHERQGGKERES